MSWEEIQLRIVENEVGGEYTIQIYDADSDSWKRITRWFNYLAVARAKVTSLYEEFEGAENRDQLTVVETYSGGTII